MPPWEKYATAVAPDPSAEGDGPPPSASGAELRQGPSRLKEAGSRFAQGAGEALAGATSRVVDAGTVGGLGGLALQVGSEEWNAVTQGVTQLLQPMFEPKTPDAVAEQAAVETNKKHGILDPRHVVTPEEKANLSVQIAAGLVPFERIAELGAGGKAAVDAAREQIFAKTGRLTEGEQKVAAALHKAIKRQGTTKEAVVDNLRANPDRPAFHAAGEGFVPYAKGVVRTPGPGKTPIMEGIRAHAKVAYEKTKGHVGEAIGGDNTYFAKQAEKVQARREAARSGMEAIGHNPVVLDERSIAGLTSDAGKAAIARQAKILSMSDDPADRQVGSYLATLSERLEADPDSVVGMRVQEVQDVSRTLIKAATSAYKRGEGDLGEELNNIGRTLRNNGKDVERGGHPQYAAWLKQYGTDSENLEAYELGYNAPTAGRENTAEKIKQTLDGMDSEAAKDHYREGLGEGLLYEIRNAGDAQTIRKFMKSQEFRDKVAIAFPDAESYDRFEEALEERLGERERSNAVKLGSDTAANLATKEDLEKQGRSSRDRIKSVAHAVRHPVRAALSAALDKAADMLPEDQGLLANPETHDILGRALSDPKEMERLLNASGEKAAFDPKTRQGPGLAGTAAMRGGAMAASGTKGPPASGAPTTTPAASPSAAPASRDATPPADGPWSRYKAAPAANGLEVDDLSPTSYDEPSGQVGDLLSMVKNAERSGDSAVSPKGAYGRYQITPATAKTYGLDYERLKDPEYSKMAATRILTHLNDRYDGDIAAVLVAYNAGPGRADRWLAADKDPSVLPEETRNYLIRSGLADDAGSDYDALLREYGKVA